MGTLCSHMPAFFFNSAVAPLPRDSQHGHLYKPVFNMGVGWGLLEEEIWSGKAADMEKWVYPLAAFHCFSAPKFTLQTLPLYLFLKSY